MNKLLVQSNKNIEYDKQKRFQTLLDRGLDFARASEVFIDAATIEDERGPYGEQRFISYGFLDDRLVVLVWTVRGAKRRIISMRKANEREIKKYIK
ncbi:BrnT family toxin [Polynucleobacter antarcticus]|uniref:BrnT family toxin n=1 Tax=Polynucleobacter antarcticus TaxID=1743162 RepID=A0A6M9PSI6_9BURK|nr:BrnT family toxin [Polynucleobacter antarcticus]QKM62802.1 BrnT family toxin [Polynucleobacter antarcticus]